MFEGLELYVMFLVLVVACWMWGSGFYGLGLISY